VATFRIGFSPSQRRKAGARLNCGTILYNACLREALNRADVMRNDPRWIEARSLSKNDPKRQKLFNEVCDISGFTERGMVSFGSKMRRNWLREGVASQEAQNLAVRAFRATARWIYAHDGRPRFKAVRRGIHSMSSKDDNGAIRLTPDGRHVQWGRSFIAPLIVDELNPVHQHALVAINNDRVLYTRIIRRRINDRWYYYAQIVCDGYPLQQYETGTGTIGLDLGPSNIGIVSDDGAWLEQFCAELELDQAQIRRIQRKLDRQHRKGSPECFDIKGRHYKGGCKWIRSAQARVTVQRLAEAGRRQAAHRKSLHGNLANRVLAQGVTIHVENLSKVAWQKKYGKSVGFRAPGMFETMISRKAENAGGTVISINPYSGKLSQTCVCGAIIKKPLSLRVHICPCGVREQRDIWSAFLARFSTGQAPDLIAASNELQFRHDIGEASGSGRINQRVPAATRLTPAASGRVGDAI
jgi:transposase